MHRSPAPASYSFQNISSSASSHSRSREPWSLALTSFSFVWIAPEGLPSPFTHLARERALSFGARDGLGLVFLVLFVRIL